jgi:outer membrane lipoprotein
MHNYAPIPILLCLLTTLLLSACASQVPQAIREEPPGSPLLEAVRGNAADYLGREVRWGGKLIETVNRQTATRLTVLARPLDKDGEPQYTDDSAGRFIAIVPEFLDPQVYAADRRITVTGTLRRTEAGTVGEYPYTYPVVEATAWYLWPRESDTPYGYPYPGWYDPWYGPWWYDPWYYPYRYPYWR